MPEEVTSKKTILMTWLKYVAPAIIAALSSGTLSVSQSSSNSTDLHAAYDTLRKSHNELLEEYKRDHDILVSLSGAVKTISWIMIPGKAVESNGPTVSTPRHRTHRVAGSSLGIGHGVGFGAGVPHPPVAAAVSDTIVNAPALPALPEVLNKVRNLPDQVEVKAEPAPSSF